MKHWRIITIGVLAFLPLALFAAIDQYENPLGCGLDTLPKFIKAILTIIVKVGIPVATIFIIWSGFLFLTAQGDEAKLTKAKHAFVWSCIGTAVLLGAWLLATAINATIQSLGGGTSGGAGTTVDGGPCRDGGSGAGGTGGGSLAGAFCGVDGSMKNDRVVPFDGDTMGHYGLDSGDPALLSKSFAIAQNQARTNPREQAFVLVRYKGGGGVLAQTGSGFDAGVEVIPISTIQKHIIDTSILPVESIHIIHTHPSAVLGGNTDAPPSLPDLYIASEYSRKLSVPVFNAAADPNGVWEYSSPPSSTIDLALRRAEILAALPEARDLSASFGEINPCNEKDFYKAFDSLPPLSPSSQAVANDVLRASKSVIPLQDQDKKLDKLKGNPTNKDAIADIMAQREQIERIIGVDLKRVK
jgi:hypothetical protein